jgi:hypothetical protein
MLAPLIIELHTLSCRAKKLGCSEARGRRLDPRFFEKTGDLGHNAGRQKTWV